MAIYEREMGMNRYGIQLYSVRDAMEQDVKSTMQRIAQLGYTYVEFAGFFDHSAEDIKQCLDEAGLLCSGAHAPLTELYPSKMKELIAYHKTIGNPNYIIPGADLSTLEKIEEFCNVVNAAQPILEAEGIRLSYHNHAQEFAVMPWGTTIFSELEKRTNLEFQIDIFWAFHAGVNPIALLKRLKNRVRVIHLKDGFTNGDGVPLGRGEAPLRAVIDYATTNGITMIVESETLPPSGLAEAAVCMDYLKNLH